MSAVLTPDEVEEVNWYTMVYSGQHLFFRNERPRSLDELKRGEHRQLRYHRSDWLDGLFSAAASIRFRRQASVSAANA